ncbi:GH25 family lysozyme [Streptomyces sp. HPF1205]|uniref:GH25 family lysozyme n=1 Tax=Streptomyces sp. HPF1205 TaxID=2873262 RepID=UPI001CED5798|nr:GH25 family lysozyme [Streptomyces sp. HPF1205]
MSLKGIDVSSYQSTDYGTAGFGFVFVKATEGTSYVNPRHAAQVAHGRAASLVVGHYHFVRPGSMSAQVSYFLHRAAPRAGDVLALDWEDTGVSGSDKDAFLKDLRAAAPGHKAVLYCNRDFWLHRDHTSYVGDGLWIADPDAPAGRPRIQHSWLFHQYGESGGLDLNVANFAGKGALRAWAGGGSGAAPGYEPFPGSDWFTPGRRSPIVAAMHDRLVAVGCDHYRGSANKDVIGSGDIASYEAWQRTYSAEHHKGWTGEALKWPPGKETWDALHVPRV